MLSFDDVSELTKTQKKWEQKSYLKSNFILLWNVYFLSTFSQCFSKWLLPSKFLERLAVLLLERLHPIAMESVLCEWPPGPLKAV